eukprot:1110807-Pelagomonas_calceolata.AAC.4
MPLRQTQRTRRHATLTQPAIIHLITDHVDESSVSESATNWFEDIQLSDHLAVCLSARRLCSSVHTFSALLCLTQVQLRPEGSPELPGEPANLPVPPWSGR